MFTPIIKPDADIPDSEWQALSTSQQAYAEFVYDVLAYFDQVVREKLGWSPQNIRINQGKNNIVIGFDYQQQGYLFRVPKHGPKPLKRYVNAAQNLAQFDFFTKQIYIDQQCMIEHFAPGENLNQDAPEQAYVSLAKALNEIHSRSGQGFGPLRVSDSEFVQSSEGAPINCGTDDSASHHYLPPMSDAIERLTQQLPTQATVLQRLFQAWQLTLRQINAPRVLCHGDLWSNNVLYDSAKEQLTLIDWDTFGVYHREKDLHFLLSEEVPEHYRKVFFEHYDYTVDPTLMSWYRLTMNVIYYVPERYSHLLTAANHFLELMGYSDRLSVNPGSIEQGQ